MEMKRRETFSSKMRTTNKTSIYNFCLTFLSLPFISLRLPFKSFCLVPSSFLQSYHFFLHYVVFSILFTAPCSFPFLCLPFTLTQPFHFLYSPFSQIFTISLFVYSPNPSPFLPFSPSTPIFLMCLFPSILYFSSLLSLISSIAERLGTL